MITIEYGRNGEAVNDYDMWNWLSEITREYALGVDCHRMVSNECPVMAIRMAVVQDTIAHEDVQFIFNDTGEYLTINQYGVFDKQINGFADLSLSMSEEILQLAVKKRIKEKKS